MIKPVVFSNGQDLGDERVFDVLLVSLVYEDGRFDVLGVVRNSRTKMRGTNLFKHEAEDAHVKRALAWAQQACGVPMEDILRCPDFGHVLERFAERGAAAQSAVDRELAAAHARDRQHTTTRRRRA